MWIKTHTWDTSGKHPPRKGESHLSFAGFSIKGSLLNCETTELFKDAREPSDVPRFMDALVAE